MDKQKGKTHFVNLSKNVKFNIAAIFDNAFDIFQI